ncbi:hypothetical protein ACQ4M4_18910 [Leptolyngbya sp. AN02str]|uniref:hypothetical protein n=1 Tax=Leptolyngbya sp. AN02str TaxID=3423363 RepID=UPI003D321E59
MDSDNQQHHLTVSNSGYCLSEIGESGVAYSTAQTVVGFGAQALAMQAVQSGGVDPAEPADLSSPEAIARSIRAGHLLVVDKKRRNGLIICKEFHAEFAGPGAAVGGCFDEDCKAVIVIGDLSLSRPATAEERQEAYMIRRQWIRLAQQFTDASQPSERARMILNQFEIYFDAETVNRVPDDALAMLVGVLPTTVRLARRPPGRLTLKVRA